LISLSSDLGGGTEAEGMVFCGFDMQVWIEMDCFDGNDDGDAGWDVDAVYDSNASRVMDLYRRVSINSLQ
jgi:hypothetical protein